MRLVSVQAVSCCVYDKPKNMKHKHGNIPIILGQPSFLLGKTHLLCKSHCEADILFNWFGFHCFVLLKLKQIHLFVWIQTSQTGGQLYTSPYKASECSQVLPKSSMGNNNNNNNVIGKYETLKA